MTTLPRIMTVSLDGFARRMRKRRLRKAIEACARGKDERWVARQLGHRGVEIVRRHHGKKWMPPKDAVIPAVNDWSKIARPNRQALTSRPTVPA